MSEHRNHRLGTVTLNPNAPIVAGSTGQWIVMYTVGSYGIDEGGTIKVARRFASDFDRPQFDDPQGAAYTTASTTGDAKLRLHYDPKGHVRPWMKCLVVDVYDGCLAPGDTVTITFGDQSQGSPGIRAQSFIESAHEIRVLVDPTNACLVRRLPSSPIVPIVAGEPVSVVVIVPTNLVSGSQLEVFVKGEDRWGNPTAAPSNVRLSWVGAPGVTVRETTLHAEHASSGRVIATWSGVAYPSNPITVTDTAPHLGAYWADLHAQSDATVGTGTESEYFAFGRDWAQLDVMCHQGNDFQVTDEDWQRLNDVVRDYHVDGSFVVFPGFEWSANTPAGGDRNVMYLEEDLPIFRSSHWQVDEPETPDTPAHPADALYAALNRRVDPDKVCVAAHCGGRYADIRKYFDGELESLVEVASCWGVFEWLLFDAFDKGYRVGIMCNSDGHKGRPGAEGPGAGQFGIYGGLTCILAESLTRKDVFAALKTRCCYGTTGPRIDLSFTANGRPMGSEFVADGPVTIEAAVTGTSAMDSLELYSGRTSLLTQRPQAFAELASSPRIRLWWGGARIRGRGRRATWDGVIAVDGAQIVRAQPFAFDSPADGIEHDSGSRVTVRSRTTGDIDGVDLWLDQATRGTVRFDNGIGSIEVNLSELGAAPVTTQHGGLDLRMQIQRYPDDPQQRTLTLSHRLTASEATQAPLWVKAIQTDGHMAWASPIYLGRPRR
ncbi:MAG: DUF3604 domain-containing protein [Nannocystaceae bacterium]|nr:DUF3604 domain-containing protein [Nannocystaceae bacterium]